MERVLVGLEGLCLGCSVFLNWDGWFWVEVL